MTSHVAQKFAAVFALFLLSGCETPPSRSSPPPRATAMQQAKTAPAPGASTTPKPALLHLEPAPTPGTLPAATEAKNPASDAGNDAGPRRPYSIAVIGDSLSDPKAFGGEYLEYVRSRCPKTQIENFAKGGFMVNQMRRRFENEALKEATPFTHLIVFGGVNDVYSDISAGRTPAKIQADLLRIYTAAQGRGMKVVAIRIAPWGGFKRYFNETRAEATRTVNAWINAQLEQGLVDFVIDAYGLLSCGNPDFLCPEYQKPFKDGLHFGTKGHEVLGKALYEQVFKNCL